MEGPSSPPSKRLSVRQVFDIDPQQCCERLGVSSWADVKLSIVHDGSFLAAAGETAILIVTLPPSKTKRKSDPSCLNVEEVILEYDF